MKQEYIENFTNISELNLETQREIYSVIFSKHVPEEEYLEYNSTKDKFDDWKTRFLTEFGKLTNQDRLKAGHQKRDFIHSATFSGNVYFLLECSFGLFISCKQCFLSHLNVVLSLL